MSLCFIIQWIVLLSNTCVSARTTFSNVSVPVFRVSFVDNVKLCFQCQDVFIPVQLMFFHTRQAIKQRGEQTSDLSACCFLLHHTAFCIKSLLRLITTSSNQQLDVGCFAITYLFGRC